MTRPVRMAVLVAASLAALSVTAVLVMWLVFDTDRVRAQLETGLGHALGMDVRIGQPPGFTLFPGASVMLADLEVSRRGQVVATAESARVRIALFSLLAGAVRPLELHLQRPTFSIERLSPGVFNVYPTDAQTGGFNGLSLRRVRMSDARLSYLDQSSGLAWQFEQCDLDLRTFHRATGEMDQTRGTLANDGKLQCESLSQERLTISQLSVDILGNNSVFDLDVVSGEVFEGQISAQMQVDLSSDSPEFRLRSTLSRFEIGAFMTMLAPSQATTGMMDLELDLTARGSTWQDIRGSAAGTLSMTAAELVLVGYDLDVELDSYAATQRFNLIDVGAVFLAGPFGLVASRGYAFSGLLEGSGGSTRIVQMVSKWRVEDGVAQARDVAFRTPENRLALVGGLDFSEYRFRNLQVAVIDRDGCAIVEQVITGSFQQPEVKRPNVLVAAAGPLLNLIKRGMRAISNKDCKPFYTGSISPP